jgi:protein phosphatase-4 regulatory subunit 3
VVPIRDPEVEKKIHQTYRLQYLKDVVLARILDDPTFSVLNSLIFFNQFDILQHLQTNQTFMIELFSIFRDPEAPASRKKLAILFIQNCCSIAKSIQVQARVQLYSNFIHNGLFGVIDYALMEKDPSVRIAGTDVLVAMIDHDPAMMRAFIYRQINEKQKPLTHTLIELLLGEQDLGVKAQIADAIKVLLDYSQGTPLDNMGKMGDMAARIHARSTTMDSETEGFLKNFYEESAKKLFAPLRELQGRESCMFSVLGDSGGGDHFSDLYCSGRIANRGGLIILTSSRDALLLRPAALVPQQVFPPHGKPAVASGAASSVTGKTPQADRIEVFPDVCGLAG